MENEYQPAPLSQPAAPMRKSGKSRNKLVLTIVKIVLLLALIALASFGAWALTRYPDLKKSTSDVTVQNNLVLAQLKKIVAFLPEDEQPALGKIDNVEEAKKQNPEFYKNATNGDYIIIYSDKIKTAILFSPSRNQILSIVALTDEDIQALKNGAAQNTASPSPSPSPAE